ncbi:MAG: two-component regulator propeller domain-containing protein, partial [Acidobacteriota bacterium]
MKFDRFRALLFVTPVLFLTSLPAIKAQTRIDTWTTDNGLPQNSVTGLTQTADGYIWFATNEGLVRFDGVRFKVFNKSNTPEIRNNRMSGAFADKSGTIWMNTEEGEILYYEKGVFKIAVKPGEIPSGVPSSFFSDPSGRVIFYAANQHYRYQNGKFVPFAIEGIPADSYLVLTDREDGLWFGGERTLRRYKAGETKSFELGFSTGVTNRRAYEDRQGRIWIGYTEGQKQFLLRITDGRVNRVRIPFSPVTGFSEDARGDLWVSLFNNGIYRIDRKSVVADALADNLLEPVVLADKIPKISIGYLCPDQQGGMWVGTNQGLLRLAPQTIRVFSKAEGLPEENVYPVYEDSSGRIWAGIWENSLVKFEDGSFKTFLRTQDTYYPTSLFEDRNGRFWIGTISELYYLDQGRLVKLTEAAGFSPETEFSVIAQDRKNNLWFGTSRGLSRYSGTEATVFTKKDGLPDDYIIALLQTADGRIWVGTRGGLALIENGKISAFTTADGLASNYIRSLYEDSDRVLWIGSYDGGLTRFKDGKFSHFTMNEGLSSDGVFCILEDNRGWLWMNSNQGIYRIRRQELNDFADGKMISLSSIAYNKQDGMLSTEGNGGRQPAGIKARDGKLWFPTAQGIAVVDPEAVMTDLLPPSVLIEEMVVDRNPVADEKIQSAIQNQSEIVLAPNQRNLEINYTGISFINSGQVKFKYKLEGLDRDWNDVGTRRTAYYSYLPSGEYTFHVIAANRDGVWNTVGMAIKVRVLPPFYKTYWFVAACVAGLLLMIWMLYRLRVRKLAHEFNMTVEARVSERTRIARELHDTLLQSFQGLLLRFQSAAKLLPERPDEARQRLDNAIQQAAEAITEGRDAVQGLRSSAFETNDLANAIAAIAEELTKD